MSAPTVVIAGLGLAWHGIEDPTQEFKFPQRKFFAPRRYSEIVVGGVHSAIPVINCGPVAIEI